MISFKQAVGIVIVQKLEESANAGMDPYGLHTEVAQEAANFLRGLLQDVKDLQQVRREDARRIHTLRAALTTIARHDIQAIAIDALQPGARLPTNLKAHTNG